MKHSIFAMELCLRLEPGSVVLTTLRDLVAQHPETTRPGAKWKMLHHACDILIENAQSFDRGCWDFFDTDQRSLMDYDMWTKGLTTEEGAREGPSGAADPYRQEPRYMTFTIALLMMYGTNTERSLSTLCEIPDASLWKRDTFLHILKGLRVVNFAFVKSDVFYVIPGDETWGLTQADLQHEKFEYLRRIEP